MIASGFAVKTNIFSWDLLLHGHHGITRHRHYGRAEEEAELLDSNREKAARYGYHSPHTDCEPPLGPPGSGKGTQSPLLRKEYCLCHLATGDMLRGEIKNNSAIGRQVKDIMKRGELVSDDIIFKMIKKNMNRFPKYISS